MNWRMLMLTSGWVLAVLVLVWVGGSYVLGRDPFGAVGGETLQVIVRMVMLPLAAIGFMVSWFLNRSSRVQA